jgi:hypothetical protein
MQFYTLATILISSAAALVMYNPYIHPNIASYYSADSQFPDVDTNGRENSRPHLPEFDTRGLYYSRPHLPKFDNDGLYSPYLDDYIE